MIDQNRERLNRLTPEQRAALLRRLQPPAAAGAAETSAIPRRDPARPVPLSFAQERLWFLAQLSPGLAAYNIALAVRLDGRLDRPALARACAAVVRRHEVLRTCYGEAAGQPLQMILPATAAGMPPPLVDLRGGPAATGATGGMGGPAADHLRREADVLAGREAGRAFDLRTGPVLRFLLLRLAADEHRLVLVLHHIAGDAWSLGVLLQDLAAAYAGAALPALPVQYADYAVWQRQRLQGAALARQLDYWRTELAGLPPLALAPAAPAAPAPAAASTARFGESALRGGRVVVDLPAATAAALRGLGRAAGATLFMTLLAGWAVVLGRYAAQDDVAVGTAVANRERRELEGLVGFFVNVLPLRVRLGGAPTFRELLARVRALALAAFSHQDVPFEKLVEELHPERDGRRPPLVQATLQVQNAPLPDLALPGLKLAAEPLYNERAKFDLALSFAEETAPDGTLAGILEHSAALFATAAAARLAGHVRCLLAAAAAAPETPIGALPLLGGAERRTLLVEHNRTAALWPPPQLAHQLCEAAAERAPDSTAAVAGDFHLSHGELNLRANVLAHALRALGVGPERRVGLCLERGAGLAVAILAVLKAGGAWVPLDPAYPAERLVLMIDDAAPRVVLARENHRRLAGAAPVLVLAPEGRGVVPADLPADLEGGAAAAGAVTAGMANPAAAATAENAAYVIYTSGSTGRPKGVVITHRGLRNLVEGEARHRELRHPRRVLQFSSPSFDASVTELFQAAAWGGTLVYPTREERLAPRELAALLARQAVDTATLPPAAASLLVPQAVPGLATLMLAGEALPAEVAVRWAPGRRLWNAYGPTENTVCATTWECRPGELSSLVSPPIGAPLPNQCAYVLAGELEPSPAGVEGELYLGGDSLARGYLGQPGMTAERFVPNPFGGPGERLYRTGDRARWREDGAIEFLGRADQQIKLRGFRIEPGEVEAALHRAPGVREAVVAVRELAPGDRRLLAWVEADADAAAAPRGRELRERLAETLPEHMLPSVVTVVARLPRLPNGKLDRRSLPPPALDGGAGGGGTDGGAADRAAAAPRGPIEEIFAGVWSEVLGIPEVARDADFFADLGGHSLLATQVISRLRDAAGIELPVRALFEAPTVERLAAWAAVAGAPGSGEAVPQIARRAGTGDAAPLSFAQERLWFLDQLAPGLAVYNVPLAVELRGLLDVAALRGALAGLIRRHEALRTHFGEAAGRPVQRIAPAAAVAAAAMALPVVDLGSIAGRAVPAGDVASGLAAAAEVARRIATEEAARPFDLRRGPLLRARLLRLDQEVHWLLLTMHHIVSDGWSLGVVVRELAALYGGERLPELPVQYADYAVWQRAWLQGAALARQLDYWRQQAAGLPALQLPFDRARPARPSYPGGRVRTAVPAAVAAALRRTARSAGATLFMTLAAGFQALLARYHGEADVAVGTVVANRRRRELEGLIGFFVNTLVLRGRFAAGQPFAEVVARVRAATLGAYDHQDLPFERLVEEMRPARDASVAPLVSVFCVLHNAPLPAVRLPGVELTALPAASGAAKFDLSLLLAEEDGGGIAATLEYAAELFHETTAARLAAHLAHLLAAAAAAPEEPWDALPLLDDAELRQVLVAGHGSTADFGEPRPAHQPIERQAALRPAAAALVCGDQVLSYGELDRRANRLAHTLRRLGVGPEERVGLLLERGPELIVAALAVLKAGGAYVPLDPAYPRERLAFMIEDAAPRVVLAGPGLAALAAPAPVLPCAARDGAGAGDPDDAPPPPLALPDNAAYVIFTSGSTGRPKGAVVEHRQVWHLLHAMAAVWDLARPRRVLQFSSPSFDASVGEIFAALPWGGTLVLAGRGRVLPARELVALVREQAVDMAILPPSLLAVVAAEEWPGLATLVAAGEACPAEVAARWAAGRQLWNGYGPTECTVFATTCLCGVSALPPPIGRPLANLRAHVLDAALAPCAVGVPGELYIGGPGVSRGYLRRPDLTALRFVPDPFGAAGERLYRTGDRTLWRGDGALVYRGRLDQQVKLRGFRIELGEIEAVLRQSPLLREALVVLRDEAPGGARLLAYVVAAPPAGTAGAATPATPANPANTAVVVARLSADLRRHCQRLLPEHMVPAVFVPLAALPLTANGKLDRRALPAPPAPDSVRGGDFAAPRTPLEEILARIWAQVLGVTRVGVEDDFFVDLGGHSLLATQVVARVRQVLQVDLQLRSLFEAPTVAGQAALAAAAQAAAQPGATPAAPVRRPPGSETPLSFAQERLWFLEQLTPGLAVYNVPLAVRLRGPLVAARLRAAVAALVARHEVLRTRIAAVGGRPAQSIAAPGTAASAVPLPLLDLQVAARGAAEAARLAAAEAARAFDLARDLPLRAWLLRLAPDEHLLLLTLHHAASDGWSLGVLVDDLGALYAGTPLPELPVQYADFAVWQRQWLRGGLLDRELAYWRGQLGGLAPLDLPADRPRPAVRRHRGGWVRVAVPAATAVAVRQLCGTAGTTLFMVLLAALQALLARWSGQLDVAVGTAVANRRYRELEGLIGFFVNTLVLRADMAAADFAALLAQVRATTLDAYAHQDVPFERLVEELRPARDTSQNPLVQVMLVLQNAPRPALGLTEMTLAVEPAEGRTAKLDLTLTLAEEMDGGLRGVLEYDADLWDAATAERLADHFLRLLAAAAAPPGGSTAPLADLPLLSPGELRQVVEEWNRTAREPRPAATLHARVAAQALRTPAAVAVVHGGRRLTYGELADAAGVLAGRLRRAGAGAGRIVAVSLERSAEMVVALLGVLAAGAAYVPLDPAYPAERRAWLAGDAGAALGVTSTRLRAQVAGDGAVCWLCVDQPEEGAVAPMDSGWRETDPGELAYVIYTSGSTGRPKGVAIAHQSASALLDWSAATFPDAALAGVLASTSISFDLSIFELFGTLSRGGTVVLAETLFDPAAWDCGWPVTLVNTVPSLLESLLASGQLPASVQVVNLAGEALPARLVERLRAALPGAVVMNLYGPSEATTYSTWARVGGEPVPPIGRPVAGTWAYVLDGAMAPQPVGVPGELYLGGAGLARGYLGRPELTAERFLPDPLADWRGQGDQRGRGGERLYRTGDRVRWRPGGVLEYLGRLDDQVKLRGFRIEPGEVEAALAGHPAVREAAVVVRQDAAGERRLVAYVALAEAGEPAAAAAGDATDSVLELRRYCGERLPAHLVPAAFVVLPRLPLTPSGKLDRRALPAPATGEDERARRYAAPATPLEEIVAGLWADVLGRERVGVDDDFFTDLGGHSLLATQVVARLRERLRRELPLRSLFEAPTVRAWATRVAAAAGKVDEAAAAPIPRRPAEPGEPAVPLPLSFAQERLWFLEQLTPGLPVYNLPLAVRLRGRLDVAALAGSWAAVVRRHEALRTRFRFAAGRPVQEVVAAAAAAVPLPLVDLSALPGEGAAAAALTADEAARPFDLGRGLLARGVLLRMAADEHLLLLTLHHIASDGWSLGVLFHELGALYAGETLPPLPVQYPDYALWQRQRLQGTALAAQLDYWRRQLAALPVLQLPLDRPRPAVLAHRGAQLRALLPAPLAAALRRLAATGGATLFMTLAAGFQVLLARHSGQRDFAIGTAVANRGRRELEGLIGFFVNTLALRTSLAGEPTVRELLARTREVTLGAYAHQEVPFERLVEELRPPRDTSQNPLVQVMLVLQNTPVPARRLPELELRGVPVQSATAKFDLLVSLAEHGEDAGGGITGTWEYDDRLFDATTVARFAHRWQELLAAAAAAPQTEVAALPLLDAAERRQILAWSAAAVDFGALAPVHTLFEAQAARTPDAVAVVAAAGSPTLTYAELERQANRLAHHLRAAGVGCDTRVGLAVPRGPLQIAALLAVLKAGGAYVPLDLAYPPARLARMVEDAAPRLVLTVAEHRALAGTAAACCLDALAERLAALPAAAPPPPAAVPESAAFVIFTSGSTGRPKGVAMPHAALANLLAWQRRATPGAARTLQLAPASFDASFHEIFTTFGAGGTLVLVDEALRRDPHALWRRLIAERVERLFITFTALQSLAQARPPDASASCLGEVLISGERLQATAELVALARALPGCTFHNLYGPTETHVVTALRLDADAERWEPYPSIGGPIANACLQVLDEQLRPVPIGVAGELCVGGVVLARGYLDRPEATAERFVPDARGDAGAGGRLYRTGDRVRWRPGGDLEYLGRLDQQVKLRGFRIEPGEVEAVLRAAAGVSEAAVVVREDTPGDARLVAYLTAAAATPGEGGDDGVSGLDPAELRRHCQGLLPAHMVPSAFVALERLPLTPSGKLDRRALAALPAAAARGGAALAAAGALAAVGAYVAPQGEMERTVAAAWQEVLGVERVGVGDNFFDLGGHSLLVLRLHALLVERLGRDLAVVDLFRHPTVESFARFVVQPVHPAVGAVGAAGAASAAESGAAAADKGRQLAAGRGRLGQQLAARQGAARRRPS